MTLDIAARKNFHDKYSTSAVLISRDIKATDIVTGASNLLVNSYFRIDSPEIYTVCTSHSLNRQQLSFEFVPSSVPTYFYLRSNLLIFNIPSMEMSQFAYNL